MTLRRIDFIPIPAGAEPGFDHADTYRAGRRLYVANSGDGFVTVIDRTDVTVGSGEQGDSREHNFIP